MSGGEWVTLVPGPGGHLIPTPRREQPQLRWFDEDGVLHEFDDDGELTLKVKAHKRREQAPAPQERLPDIMLDEYALRIATLLERRSDLIHQDQSVDRDELIESMVLCGREISDVRIQSSICPDQRMIDIVDRLDGSARSMTTQHKHDLATVKQIDRQRFRIPAHLRKVIDLVYYKQLSISAAAGQMGLSAADTAQLLKAAIQELSRIVR